MKTIDTLDNNVFKHLITTIGALPTSFIDSMSYYEMIAWLVNYIKTEVVPAINNNAEAVKEIQDWIDTLDLSTYVGEKIDEMAASGELATLIAGLVGLGTVFGYNNIAAMAAADNLVAGSICRVLGNTTATTGDGAFYLVRSLDPSDTPDGVNLVAIGDALVGVRIPDAALNSAVAAINARINLLETHKWVFVGDSYAEGYNPDGNVVGWTTLLRSAMGLTSDNCTFIQAGGAGFANTSNKYENMITAATADNEVTDVLICGGYNDLTYSEADIFNGMSATKAAILSKYPNVKKIYVGFIGGCANEYHGDIHIKTTYYANGCNTLNIEYLPNLEYALFNVGFLGSDKIHPNNYGQTSITRAIYAALFGGFTYNAFYDLTIDTSDSDYFSTVDWKLHLYSVNNISYLSSYDGVKYLTATADFEFDNGDLIKLGKITQTGIIGTKYYNNLEFYIGNAIVQSYNTPSGYFNMPAKIVIDKDGYVWLKLGPAINATNDGYQEFDAIHQLQIPTFTIVYPTDSL